jgi:hypothetical protein
MSYPHSITDEDGVKHEISEGAFWAIMQDRQNWRDKIEALEKKLERVVAAVGSHNCSGRDCIGIHPPSETATQHRCGYCENVRRAIQEPE